MRAFSRHQAFAVAIRRAENVSLQGNKNADLQNAEKWLTKPRMNFFGNRSRGTLEVASVK